MKFRNTAIAAALSLVPIGQPLLTGTGAALTTTGVILSVSQKVQAESTECYKNRGIEKFRKGDL